MTENWKPVVDYEGLYEVSDLGRVRSLDRTVTRSNGTRMSIQGRVLTPWVRKRTAHQYVPLSRGGSRRVVPVHHLVLEAFVSPRPEGYFGLHGDDDPSNNHVSNLRWGTPSDNEQDKVRNGLHNHARKTHCPQGHEYTAENTYVLPSRPTARYCRACYRDRRQAKRAWKVAS